MNIFTSFIFNRSVLGLLVGACFIVFFMNVYFDNTRQRVLNSASLLMATNDINIITQLAETYENQPTTPANADVDGLVNQLNKKLADSGSDLKLQVLDANAKKDAFQEQAYNALITGKEKYFYQLEGSKNENNENEVRVRYAVKNIIFKKPADPNASILEITFPMSGFKQINDMEANNILWTMVILAIIAISSLAVFLGHLRSSAEMLMQTQVQAFNLQKRLTQAYERFFPHRFLELLDKQSILDIQIGDAVQKQMAVLFADIRNFTTILEHKTPAESFKFINDYMERIGPVVREHNGFIDKYIGDAIMALFEKSPDEALQAAIKILRLLIQSTEQVLSNKDKITQVGIGIHFGPLMTGIVGEKKRMDGTVIGDTVNTASRIEALNKYYGSSIIISEELVNCLANKDAFKLRFIDYVQIRGRAQNIKIYEVFDNDASKLINKKVEAMPDYNAAIANYYERNFADALAKFQLCQKLLPEDKVVELYIMRCKKLLRDGVSQDWDGVTKYFRKTDYL